MVLFIKFLIIIVLLSIFYQDNKERLVSAYLYFLVTALGVVLYSFDTPSYLVMFFEILINILIVSLVLIFAFISSKLLFKYKFLNHSFGVGDLFMFLSVCFLFPSTTFIIFFVFSLLFSLIIHLFINKKNKTIPLAGYMSLFYALIFIFTIIFNFNPYSLY